MRKFSRDKDLLSPFVTLCGGAQQVGRISLIAVDFPSLHSSRCTSVACARGCLVFYPPSSNPKTTKGLYPHGFKIPLLVLKINILNLLVDPSTGLFTYECNPFTSKLRFKEAIRISNSVWSYQANVVQLGESSVEVQQN